MLNLKDLDQEKRIEVTIGCEPYFIEHKKYPELRGVHSKLMEELPSNHSNDLWVFLCACINPIKYGMTGSLFSLDKNHYTHANNKNKDTKTPKISYTKCKRIIEKLDKAGYITFYKGFYDHYEKISLKSCFIINDPLRFLLNDTNIKRVGKHLPIETLVELRSSEDKSLITELGKLRGITSKRYLVKKYNESLRNFDIRCKTFKVSAVYKRVFTDNFESHGRWYTQGCLQTTKSEYRKYLTINGLKTTEVDIKQMHPRILMTLEGVYRPMSWEPYADITDIVGGDYSTARKFSKYCMMCLLNAKDETSAKSAIWKEFSDEIKKKDSQFKGLSLKKGCVNKIIQRLKDKNKEISHWFGKENLWAILQHYDSEITAFIVERFIDLGKCLLPWHDSYVVQFDDRDLLIETIREAWFYVLKDTRNCFYDIEF